MKICKKILISFVLMCITFSIVSCGDASIESQGDEELKLPPFPAVAENFAWEIKDGILGIIGNGGMPDYETFTSTPWYEKRNEVKEIVLYDGITSVGKLAFSGMNTVTEIHLPETVTHIGEKAFSECGGLDRIILPESLLVIGANSFNGCAHLKNIDIPDKVSYIGDYAFSMCASIEKIEIPDGIEAIGEYVFFQCNALKEATIPATVKSIGVYAFSSCSELEHVFYVGTSGDWDAISKGNAWDENSPKLNVYFSE